MTTITTRQCQNALQALAVLAQRKFPMSDALHILRGHDILDGYLKPVRQLHKELLERYVERDEEGNKVVDEDAKPGPDGSKPWRYSDVEKMDAEYEELMSATVECAWTMPVKMLGKTIEPSILIALGPLLQEDEEPSKAGKRRKK
jgi:hypothetical protein